MIFEAKKTLRLAGPIILGELLQMGLHVLDTAMVGAVNYKQLAAVSLAFAVINIPFVLGIGLSVSVSQMVSLANGRRDAKQVSHYLFNGFALCLVAGIIISASLYFGSGIVYYLRQDNEVALLAEPFMKLVALSILPFTLFMSLKMFADGLEYTRTGMLISIIAVPMNVFINYILIFGNWGAPRLELLGAGYGTLITRILMLVAMLGVVLRAKVFRKYIAVRAKQWQLRWATWGELLYIGIPSSMQIAMEAGAFAVSGILAGMLGPVAQASHQIALSIVSFTFMVSMGLAQAGSIRVSNQYGQQNFAKIRLIGISTLAASLIYGILCAILMGTGRNLLAAIFNQNPEVLGLAGILLVYAAVFQVPDALQAIGSGLLRGLKDVKVPTFFVFLSYWVIGIPVGSYLAFKANMGVRGIWLGLIMGLVASSILLLGRFLRHRKLRVQ